MEYRLQAQYYKNSNIINRTKAVIHLENKNDLVFWEPLFQKRLSEHKFGFVFHSKNQNGNRTNGCIQCLKFSPHLSDGFMIAIDSDYRHLMSEPNINIQNFVFQTYTYSFENHFCYAKQLDEVCKKVCNFDEVTHHYSNRIFDFNTFLEKYSFIIYDLFIWHISLLKLGNNTCAKDNFQSTIDIKNLQYDIHDDCRVVLDGVKQKIDAKVKQLETQFPAHDLGLAKEAFATLGIAPTNVYMYIRGHDLHNALILIIRELSNLLLDAEKQKIEGDNLKKKELYDRKSQDIKKEFAEAFKNQPEYNIYSQIISVCNDMDTYNTKYR